MNQEPLAEYPGDPRHPDHGKYLLALGRATYQAALLFGTCYDILRVWSGHEGRTLEKETLGGLKTLLDQDGERSAAIDGELGSQQRFGEFMAALGLANNLRNDLIHALPTMHGLQRRGSKVIVVEGGVWTFYTPESVDNVTEAIALANRLGAAMLYADGGDRVDTWYAKQSAC